MFSLPPHLSHSLPPHTSCRCSMSTKASPRNSPVCRSRAKRTDATAPYLLRDNTRQSRSEDIARHRVRLGCSRRILTLHNVAAHRFQDGISWMASTNPLPLSGVCPRQEYLEKVSRTSSSGWCTSIPRITSVRFGSGPGRLSSPRNESSSRLRL